MEPLARFRNSYTLVNAMARKRKRFRVVAVFDTETTNIIEPGFIEAFPVLYIFNDLRNCNLRTYTPGAHDKIEYFRYEQEAIAYIDSLVEYGRAKGVIPVVCAYNLMFDLHSLLHRLSNAYDLSAIAQSSTNAYAVDLMIDGETVLRFWDTFHLEMNGLAAMGRTAGLEKATGDWDYSLIRTPETPLTDDELFYAGRDTQVIPAYLRYLLDAYEWLEPPMFAHTVLTKTSLVRQLAQNEIGRIKVGDYTLFTLFLMRCKNELPPDYDTYALRKACFRGGFTFTSAMAAGLVVKNVQSWDVTSMHHAYINGRRVPVQFQRADRETLQAACEAIAARPLQAVLRRYDYPFAQHIHACVCFKGLRLRAGSAFEEWQIGLLSKSKFGDREPAAVDFEYDERNKAAGEAVRSRGYRDSAIGAVYAFGKLYSADTAYIFCNEVELWNISRVYEWDSMEAVSGEISIKTVVPPDYVTLQSNILFERKSDAKYIDGRYKEGTPYAEDIPDTIPDGIAAGLKEGDISNAFFKAWYQSSVKGAFN